MAAVYYIDGYNVIYHCSKLRPLALEDFEAARDALIERVARFCGMTRCRAQIVFDGRGRRHERVLPPPGAVGLKITYSAAHQSADSLIERLVYTAHNRRDIQVVSSDRGIRDLCTGLGAFAVHPDNFLGTIDAADAEFDRSIAISRQADQKPRVEDHLDQDAIDRLNRLKESLENQ